MSRTLFSAPLGLIATFMSSFPLLIHASNVMEGPDDAPQGKIVGHGAGTVGQQNVIGSVPPDRDMRAWTAEGYHGDNARNYSSYNTTTFPTTTYNSYYGATGYPNAYNAYYGTAGYPTTTYSASYYGATGYPNTYNAYYGTTGYPTTYNPSYYGSTGYPATTYNAPYGNYGDLNILNNSYYNMSGSPTSFYNPYGTYNYNYPYSSYSTYPNPYGYTGYRPYYPGGSMYNPNTTFVNPPSSLNAPRYPVYSETYLYR
jgi:hypothetical protein